MVEKINGQTLTKALIALLYRKEKVFLNLAQKNIAKKKIVTRIVFLDNVSTTAKNINIAKEKHKIFKDIFRYDDERIKLYIPKTNIYILAKLGFEKLK